VGEGGGEKLMGLNFPTPGQPALWMQYDRLLSVSLSETLCTVAK